MNNPRTDKIGEIEMNNVNIRYRPGLKLILQNLTLKIRKGQKVAIVGRTGSGKSTLILALTRILELDHSENTIESSILINGVNIEKIGLH